jgi:hypothetical protein
MEATRRNLQAQPKILKKIIGTPNLPIKKKVFPKKVCLNPQKCKGAKNSYWGYPTESAPGALKTIELKLSSKNLNLKRRSVNVERKKVMRITKFADRRRAALDGRPSVGPTEFFFRLKSLFYR